MMMIAQVGWPPVLAKRREKMIMATGTSASMMMMAIIIVVMIQIQASCGFGAAPEEHRLACSGGGGGGSAPAELSGGGVPARWPRERKSTRDKSCDGATRAGAPRPTSGGPTLLNAKKCPTRGEIKLLI
jgi:hypothetical protein